MNSIAMYADGIHLLQELAKNIYHVKDVVMVAYNISKNVLITEIMSHVVLK